MRTIGAKMRLEPDVRITAICPFLLTVALAVAQTEPRKSFEVASIKLSAPISGDLASGMAALSTAGVKVNRAQASFTRLSVVDLVARAYRVEPFQVSGPNGVDATKFDIVAKLPEGESQDLVPEMLQTLLIERFGLKSHTVPKEFAVYTLRVAEGRAQTDRPASDEMPINLDVCSNMLAMALGQPVLNRTEMQEPYKLSRQFFARIALRASWQKLGAKPELETVMKPPSEREIVEGLKVGGLLVEARKLPLGMIVIDQVEKTPKEN